MTPLFQILISLVYIVSSGIAVYRGYKKHFVILALILALAFQYLLGFSAIAQTVVAAIFVLHFVIPLAGLNRETEPRQPDFDTGQQNTHMPPPNPDRTQAVFNDFQDFTNEQSAAVSSETEAEYYEPQEQENWRLQEELTQARRQQQNSEQQLHHANERIRDSQQATPRDRRSSQQILGLPENEFSIQDLKDARRREVLRWNPTNMVNKPPELVNMAETELQKINAAYSELMQRFR